MRKRVPLHSPVLHASVSSRLGHASPPFTDSWMTSRALVLVPPSQAALHSPHADQSSTLQSTENFQILGVFLKQIFAMMTSMLILLQSWVVMLVILA